MNKGPHHLESVQHATAVVLGDLGLLIKGASQSGKSILALMLIEEARRRGRFGALIADDQVSLKVHTGHVIASHLGRLEGLIECGHLGILRQFYIDDGVMDRIICLAPVAECERLPDYEMEEVLGCKLPKLTLPERQNSKNLLIIQQWLNTERVNS